MAFANLVSIFKPKKIIPGDGVFESAVPFPESIRQEAERWEQPIAISQVSIEIPVPGLDA
jgi:glucokinase